MKRYLLKKLVLSAYFIVMSFLIVMVTFPVMKMGVIPKRFMVDVCFVFVIASITFLLPLLVQEIVHVVILLAELIIMVVSASLYLSRGDVFSWELIKQIGQVKDVSDMIKLPAWSIVAGVLFLAGYVVLWVVLKAPKIQLKNFYSLVMIGITADCVAVFSCSNVLVHKSIISSTGEHYYVSDSYYFSTYQSSYVSLQKFGYYGFYVEDLLRKVFPALKPKTKDIEEVGGYNYNNYTSILNGLCKDNNVIMILAESFEISGISKELTPVLWSLKYGKDLSQSGISDYYNVAKNNGQTSISRKDFNRTETGYEFNGTDIFGSVAVGQVGLQLSQYRSHDYTESVEMKAITSSWKFDTDTWDCNYTIAKELDDYSSTYIHGNTGNFYKRKSRMDSLVGFDRALFIEDMQLFAVGEMNTLNCYSMDSETIRHYTDDKTENVFPVDEKFLTFFMTITTHGQYEYSSQLDENYAFVDAVIKAFSSSEMFSIYRTVDEFLQSVMKEYYARVLDTEYALAYLVNYLYENDILDKTIISFTGDHIAPLPNINVYSRLFVENVLHEDETQYADVVEAFIYSTNIKSDYLSQMGESRVVSHATEAVDLLPTILTLLGRDYEQDKYMGYAVINKSVQNPDETVYNKVFYSYNYGGFENEFLKSPNGTDVLVLNSKISYTSEQKEQFIKDCNDVILKNNYVLENRKK